MPSIATILAATIAGVAASQTDSNLNIHSVGTPATATSSNGADGWQLGSEAAMQAEGYEQHDASWLLERPQTHTHPHAATHGPAPPPPTHAPPQPPTHSSTHSTVHTVTVTSTQTPTPTTSTARNDSAKTGQPNLLPAVLLSTAALAATALSGYSGPGEDIEDSADGVQPSEDASEDEAED